MKQDVVLITGCSSGIGRHTAIHLANNNYKVYAGMLNPQKEEASLKKATTNPNNLYPLKLDIAHSNDIKEAVEKIIEKEKKIDVLINNAAYGLFGPVDSCTIEEVKQQFDVNLFGTIELTHRVIPYFRKQHSGKIICMSSIRAFKSSSVQGPYSATKAALEAIALSWASTLSSWNIYVSLVELGATATSFADHMVFGSKYVDKNKNNPYPNMVENSLALIKSWKENSAYSQKPQEIAKIIEKIIKNKEPPLRIQPNKSIQKEMSQFNNDLSGKDWLAEEKEFFKKWFYSE